MCLPVESPQREFQLAKTIATFRRHLAMQKSHIRLMLVIRIILPAKQVAQAEIHTKLI